MKLRGVLGIIRLLWSVHFQEYLFDEVHIYFPLVRGFNFSPVHTFKFIQFIV